MPPLLVIPFAIALGLVVGSFLNVVAHRVPRGESIVFPASKCTYCDGSIRALDNIPLLSYLFLRGRCRRCRAPISARYPLLEALTGLLFGACAWRFGWSGDTLVALVFCGLLVALAAIDSAHFLLPDKITLPGILVGLALQPLFSRATFVDAAIGALAGAGGIVLIGNYWYWLREEEGMGLGDVNMLAMIGAFLGWQGALIALVAAAAAGALFGVALIATGAMGFKSRLPFGVFLALGALAALFWGSELSAAYLAYGGFL